MPLGASITLGLESSHDNGYRKDLYDLLEADGYKVDMVGSRRNGTMKDNEHEGWPGLRVKQVMQKAELSVPDRLPNLFTVNAGTNDCAQKVDVEHVGDRMETMLNYLWEVSPQATVILSTLIYNRIADVDKCVQNVNTQYVSLAETLQSKSKKIVLVDMHSSDGPQEEDMSDDTHPGDEGYKKMAKIWLRGIEDAASKGWLEKPEAIDENDNSSKTSSSDGVSTVTSSATASPSTDGSPVSEAMTETSSSSAQSESGAFQKPGSVTVTMASTLVTVVALAL